MSCSSEKRIHKYVKGELHSEEQRVLEDHLYSCDRCLGQYMYFLDEQESQMPTMLDQANFTNQVIESIGNTTKTEGKRSSGKQLAHYAIAAGFTLMLMFTGVFDGLTTIVSEDAMNPNKSGSFSNEMLNRTVAMIELINKNEKEGN